MKNNLTQLETLLDYNFKNKELLIQALTHSSASADNYEKLEFLGDSLLSSYVTKHIFNYTNLKVGEMSTLRSNLVSTTSLSNIILEYGINKFVILGDSLANNSTHITNILADIFESLLAAIYIDGGESQSLKFVNKFLLSSFNENVVVDYKTKLQELIQKHYNGTKIEYRELGHTGPSHDLTFNIGLFLNGEKQAEANGKTKKQAEQLCANIVFNKLKVKG